MDNNSFSQNLQRLAGSPPVERVGAAKFFLLREFIAENVLLLAVVV